MAVSNLAAFAQVPARINALCTQAKPIPTGSSTTVPLLPGPGLSNANGSRVVSLGALPLATVTSTRVDVFHVDGGGNYNLVASGTVNAQTVTQVSAISPTSIPKADGSGAVSPTNPLYVPPGQTLVAAIAVALATGINVLGDVDQF